ncbi:phosphoribosylaminoimidazolesuccinocarboxamide synthase [Staphylococcus sp. SQ8-PEA]|uniref:Phosphoribosylaminoimidazole-succinocarboxamide synthase n=1 Tax=Staphylococcus marylandisciuri TaxID=2981529 RepID=A0ABT2QNQ3_9STAP|nr:phosphoribosylaminoimidazolesuccinocarboxamide synthase [Staphylococcus marylandisciuri]MCU5745615.1 phosphoribosylaminoimidazolesuccinocarboxamide synthase [Staphylococcus marylandisciuri]
MSLLYEGKAKRIFTTEEENVLKVEYKDEVTAGNGAKKDHLPGKGRLNNLITSKIFEYLNDQGLKSHFIERISETEQIVEQVEIIPLEVVVRNIAAGSITKRLGFEKGHKFNEPLVEFFYKNDDLNDPLITDAHIKVLEIADDKDIEALQSAALEINNHLQQLMSKMDLRLVDFKIEFGRTKYGNLILADEISPDTCRIWAQDSDENFDKDVYREDRGSIIDVYQSFLNKLEDIK